MIAEVATLANAVDVIDGIAKKIGISKTDNSTKWKSGDWPPYFEFDKKNGNPARVFFDFLKANPKFFETQPWNDPASQRVLSVKEKIQRAEASMDFYGVGNEFRKVIQAMYPYGFDILGQPNLSAPLGNFFENPIVRANPITGGITKVEANYKLEDQYKPVQANVFKNILSAIIGIGVLIGVYFGITKAGSSSRYKRRR